MISERPLVGCVVGISISESEEMERLGFDRREMNRCVVRLSESLLGAGARLAFGHDWRPGGVMEAVAALAVRYFNLRRDEKGEPLGEPPIINRVEWTREPFLWQERRVPPSLATEHPPPVSPMARLLEGIVEAKRAPQPATGSNEPADTLTAMREELAGLCHLRICLGGKLTGYSGRKPGIIEEAQLTLARGRPVLASNIFGGAARVVVCGLSEFEVGPLPDPPGLTLDLTTEANAIAAAAKQHKEQPLKPPELERLWKSTSVEECVDLCVCGAVRWWRIVSD
jgi:hypothetical protein